MFFFLNKKINTTTQQLNNKSRWGSLQLYLQFQNLVAPRAWLLLLLLLLLPLLAACPMRIFFSLLCNFGSLCGSSARGRNTLRMTIMLIMLSRFRGKRSREKEVRSFAFDFACLLCCSFAFDLKTNKQEGAVENFLFCFALILLK